MEVRRFLLCVYLFIPLLLFSQPKISVISFKYLQNDLDARIAYAKTDQNGERCALIKIVTHETGFVFETGQLGIVDAVQKTGEWWVYVPRGSKRITIKHAQLGILRDYIYPEPINEACVYEMVLSTGKVTTTVEEVILSQWLIITSQPQGADVYINDEMVGTTPFQREFKLGKYNYRISKVFYQDETGEVDLTEADGKYKIEAVLKYGFGSVLINTSPENGSTVIFDGVPVTGETPLTVPNVKAGQHSVTVNHPWYKSKKADIDMTIGENKELKIDMEAAFATVNIQSQEGALIYINNEEKGSGNYSTRLFPGLYTFEARKENYNIFSIKKEMIAGKIEQIDLPLTPKTGTLKIVSMPLEASVSLNGKDYGSTPQTIRNLLIGNYEVQINKAGFLPVKKNVIIKENEIFEIDEILVESEKNQDIGEKEIIIGTGTLNSQIFLDDKLIGVSSVRVKVPFGKHRLLIKTPYYRTITKEIDVTTDGQSFFIPPENIMLGKIIHTYPSKATMKINGKYAGKSPDTVALEDGNNVLLLSKKGYIDQEHIITNDTSLIRSYLLYPKKYHQKGTALILSAIIPGAGHTYLNRGKPYWLMSGAVYGLLAFSYITYHNAVINYDLYRAEEDETLRNEYANKWEKQLENTQYILYGAGAAWTINMITTLIVPTEKKKYEKLQIKYNSSPAGNTMGLLYTF